MSDYTQGSRPYSLFISEAGAIICLEFDEAEGKEFEQALITFHELTYSRLYPGK
jgi:hypothetical protein